MPMTTRRLLYAGSAVLWLAAVVVLYTGAGLAAHPLIGWAAFAVMVAPAVLALHLLGKRFGATRSPRRPPDA